ncbi:putative major facilitator superfamily transporter [Sphingomonas changbaiensis NBRC 104936]|uniref:Putative major facilitator superfamily transporter n=1 Tax=Sphingomonas changbaiensis NBRC 104936 TaxID=1219043 RepID=A0A0E9MTK8_9SPHN|nr:TCR/Tet family MFS transporter [Sphingomonas changbaiensis]GAO40455.1 putative major facilitator superfamily transporter [Sphingomonas changbaiensis NBRC 104936]
MTQRGIGFVLATIFIDAIGFGLIMPVLPRLLMAVGDFRLPRAIEIGAWMGLAIAVATFFAAPVLGNLSDRFGRRPVLLIALAGMAIDYLLLAVAGTIWLIFIGRVLSGALGGSYAPAQAAIADQTAPEDRARTFGLVSAAFGIGFIAGPAIGGLLSAFGNRAPFYAASALAALNFLYGLTIFPETLPVERRRAFDWRRANPLGALAAARAVPNMMAVAVVLTLWQIASMVYPMTWSFYTIAQFGWSNAMIGASFAAVGLIMALTQTFLTGPLVKRLGERDAATLGLVGAIVGFLAYAFATQSWMAFAIMVAIAVQSLVQPSLMAMLSRRASPETQGEVQGVASMAMGIGAIVAPLALTRVMAEFTKADAPVHFPGAAFLVAALFGLGALVLLRRLPRVGA